MNTNLDEEERRRRVLQYAIEYVDATRDVLEAHPPILDYFIDRFWSTTLAMRMGTSDDGECRRVAVCLTNMIQTVESFKLKHRCGSPDGSWCACGSKARLEDLPMAAAYEPDGKRVV